jgi:hypothetical protein
MGANSQAKMRGHLFAFVLQVLGCAAAGAAPLTAAEATALLARVHAIDAKCQVLSPTDREDLARHLSDARILLEGRTSPETSAAAVAAGMAVASASTCSADEKVLVAATLALARRATRSVASQGNLQVPLSGRAAAAPADLTTSSISPAPEAPAVLLRRKRVAAASLTPRKIGAAKPATRPAAQDRKGARLKRLAGLAQRYFRDLRCRTTRWTGRAAAQRRYPAKITQGHTQAFRGSRRAKPASVLQPARARAAANRCG